MRDAQSKLDQVLAFTGKTITAEDVATVLGLVGRDLLLDTVEAVADENAPASFALVARALEMGYDLRAVCRELTRVLRDLLVLTVDPSRISDPEIAGEGERDRLKRLAGRFSREDLLRAFDLLTRAEADIRSAAQPRYHLEMALLRWMYLRQLVSIEELIANAGAGSGVSRALPERPPAPRPAPAIAPVASVARSAPAPARPEPVQGPTASAPAASFKDALLAEIKKSKSVFYNMVVAQAQKIEVAGDRVTFTFSPLQRALRETFEQHQTWLEALAQQIAGRRIAVAAVQTAQGDAAAAPAATGAPPAGDRQAADKQSALRQQALADAGVQTMLDVFPAEIRDVEEM
jgi:DNA polymerase-3 subunit gamma/tau